MFVNRRATIRAVLSEGRCATLAIGREKVRVLVTDESAGGYCVLTSEPFSFRPDVYAQLMEDDLTSYPVRISYVRQFGIQARIGLERGEAGHRRVSTAWLGALPTFAILIIGAIISTACTMLIILIAAR